MTDFYDGPDRFYRPIIINDANDEISVTEDVGGAGEVQITATLPHTDTLGDDTDYYGVSLSGAGQSGNAGTVSVLDAPSDTFKVRPLYDEIAKALSDESTANGLGLDYRISANTPTGSDQTNSGLTLFTNGGSTTIRLEFLGVTNPLDPRYFGLDEDANQSAADTAIDLPYSRWGDWQSPISRTAHDKRLIGQQQTFRSNSDPYLAKRWRFTRQRRHRDIQYIGVAGAHIWPDDRASRSEEAARAGLPVGDRNNALHDIWERVSYGDRRVLIVHNEGDQGLDAPFDISGVTEVVRVRDEFAKMFQPQAQTDREHAGEKYDITIPVALASLDSYNTANVSPWEH